MRNFQPGEIVHQKGRQPGMVRPRGRRRRGYQRARCAAQRRAV